MMRVTRPGAIAALAPFLIGCGSGLARQRPALAAPVVLGETFTIESSVLGEDRRINVFRPTFWGEEIEGPLPVLYMPDGGMAEDFLHIAGLVQVSVSNGTMRPFLLVGIENTERRRDMTGPTENAEDRKIAPRVGGAATFRRFLRNELMPEVRARYVTTNETAIVGESLAGLFVVETLFLESDLFDTYIAVDPSLWWNDADLVEQAAERLRTDFGQAKVLYIASSSEAELAALSQRLAEALAANGSSSLHWQRAILPDETHATVYHPAALRAFRNVLAPAEAGGDAAGRSFEDDGALATSNEPPADG